jgi:hypothetical protein
VSGQPVVLLRGVWRAGPSMATSDRIPAAALRVLFPGAGTLLNGQKVFFQVELGLRMHGPLLRECG